MTANTTFLSACSYMSSLSIGGEEKAFCLRGEAFSLLTFVSIFWYFSLQYFLIKIALTLLNEISLIKSMLWLTNVDITPKREWMFLLSISVGCQLLFWVLCSTVQQQSVSLVCFHSVLFMLPPVHSHRRGHSTRTQRTEDVGYIKWCIIGFPLLHS